MVGLLIGSVGFDISGVMLGVNGCGLATISWDDGTVRFGTKRSQ